MTDARTSFAWSRALVTGASGGIGEAMARRLCLGRIFTEASITARPFFARRGFTVIAPQVLEFEGITFKNYRMEKLLG